MLFVLYLFGDLLTRVCSTACHSDCFCFTNTMNCSKLSLADVPDIPETIAKVDLAYNSIFQLPEQDMFLNLEFLDLSRNKLKFIEMDLRKSIMKNLKLSGNPLKHVNIHSNTLIELDLSFCDISYLQSDFLEAIPSLEVLDLSYNPLKVIQPMRGKLKELFLQGCLFRRVLFELPELEVLDISYNRYMTLLKLESNLTTLRASHASIHEVEFSLPKLKTLELSHNKLSYFSLDNPSLEELDISGNSLRNLHIIDESLSRLDLSHNLLTDLELSLDRLLFLNVSFNPLVRLKIYSERLLVVDCASCQLKHIDLPPVHTLNLSRNGLEGFSGEATVLDLSYNMLDAYKGGAEFVDLRGNRLSLPKKVTVTDSALLGNNPWMCKCEDSALKELYMKAVDKVSCASPEGKSWDTCYTPKLPKYMKDYPWIPLAVSGVLTIVVIIGIFVMKQRLWADGQTSPRSSHDITDSSIMAPIRVRIQDDLPSYEEALLMHKPNYSNRRSYEIVPNRRLSSSSI